jgi:hypothetical protein
LDFKDVLRHAQVGGGLAGVVAEFVVHAWILRLEVSEPTPPLRGFLHPTPGPGPSPSATARPTS